jgi:hypothetical protein
MMKSVVAVLIWTILHILAVSTQNSQYPLITFEPFVCGKIQVPAEYHRQQDDEFSWNQIRDIDDEPKAPQQRWPHGKIATYEAPKIVDGPFHIIATFFEPIFSVFHSSVPTLKASINDTNLPLHGTKTIKL